MVAGEGLQGSFLMFVSNVLEMDLGRMGSFEKKRGCSLRSDGVRSWAFCPI